MRMFTQRNRYKKIALNGLLENISRENQVGFIIQNVTLGKEKELT